jgi:hypothetical protein
MAAVTCQQCGGPMKKTATSSGNCLGLTIALIVFVAGLTITITTFWTIIGAVIGILMMVASLFIGGKKQKVWKCRKCGYVFNRA